MNREQAEALNLRFSIGFSVFTLLFAEMRMWLCYSDRVGPELIAEGTRGSVKSLVYWSTAALLAAPILLGWIQSKQLERKMKELGADWFSINLQKKTIFGNLGLAYLIVSFCLSVIR